MEEIKCQQVGQIVGSGFTEMTGRIYSTNGLTPSIRTFAGGNTEVKIAEPIIYDDYNGRIRADQECIGTLTTNCGNDALRNGVKIIEPICLNSKIDGKQPSLTDRVYDTNGISTCVTTSQFFMGNIAEPSYQIRKLTERECFRLQGVKEEDFERVAKNQSTSSLYHLAGDSITTTCLMAIFGELFVIDYKAKINELVEELRQ